MAVAAPVPCVESVPAQKVGPQGLRTPFHLVSPKSLSLPYDSPVCGVASWVFVAVPIQHLLVKPEAWPRLGATNQMAAMV